MPSAARSDTFKSLADARRQFRPGRRVLVTNYRHPWLSFESTIRRNGLKEFALDCPRRGTGWLTWQQWPKADDFDPSNGDVYWTKEAVRTKVFTFTLLD